jgi:excisionase family DNA binding protein
MRWSMAKDKEIMTAKEVAEYLSIHPLTVHKYAREGKIPAFKIGTDWRFHKKHIERWIKEKSASGMYARAHKDSVLDKV